MPSFTAFARPRKSSAALDELEGAWWNEHSDLIERIWGLPDDLCERVRGGYVARAGEFFRSDGRPTTVLELGCGTGWFGRLLAGPDVSVIGCDGSSRQLEHAREKAGEAGKGAYCQYLLASDLSAVPNLDRVTGVVIHAFLHHLYGDELDSLFAALAKSLSPGTRFFIYEPVYVGSRARDRAAGQRAQLLTASFRAQLRAVRRELVLEGKFDEAFGKRVDSLMAASDSAGYFFSPKEVPFAEGELEALLSRTHDVQRVSVPNVLALDVAQMLTHVGDVSLRAQLSDGLFAQAAAIDAGILDAGAVGDVVSPGYAFQAYECVLRGN